MRIFFFSLSLAGRGGMESVLSTVVSRLTETGHEVTTILLNPPTKDARWVEKLGHVVYTQRNYQGVNSRFDGENGVISSILALQNVLLGLPIPDVIVAMAPWAVALARAALGVFGSRPP